jgi:hypothetical protein
MLILNKYLTNIYMRKNSLMRRRRKRSTRKHKRRKANKRRTHNKRRRKRTKYRGGYSGPGNLILTPATFSPTVARPPNGPVLVPSPGITKVATRGSEQQYYYAKNNRVMKAPESTNPQKQSGGRKRRRTKKRKRKNNRVMKAPASTNPQKQSGGRRRTKKRKMKRKRKKRKTHKRKSRKHRRRRRHRGGGLSDVVESIPGGTDVRDVFFKAGNVVGSLYSQYNGFGGTNQPPMTNYTAGQPINKPVQLTPGDIPMHQYIEDGSAQASKFEAGYNHAT